MSEVMSEERFRERGDAVNDLVRELVSAVRERDEGTLSALERVDEERVYEDARPFLEREFDADVTVCAADDAPADAEKADDAVPFRPAVYLE